MSTDKLYHYIEQGLVEPVDADISGVGASGVINTDAPLRERSIHQAQTFTQEDLEVPTLGDTLKAGIEMASSTYNLHEVVTREKYPEDPDFHPVETHQEEVHQYPLEFMDMLYGSKSEAEYQQNKERVDKTMENYQILGESGAMGTVAPIVAGIFDPITMGSFAGEIMMFSKLARAGYMSKKVGAGLSAMGGAVVEAPLLANEKITGTEAIAGVALAASFGAMFSGVPKDAQKIFKETSEEIMDTVPPVRDAGGDIAMARNGAEPRELDEWGDVVPTKAEEWKAKVDNWSSPAVDKVKQSKIFKSFAKYNPLASEGVEMLASDSKAVNKFAFDMLEITTGAVNNRSASALKLLHRDRIMKKTFDQYYTGLNDWSAEVAPNMIERGLRYSDGQMQQEFNKLLRVELESRRVAEELGETYMSKAHPKIQGAADSWADGMGDALDTLQTNGMFMNVSKSKGYVPLLWDSTKLLGLSKSSRQAYKGLLKDSYTKMGINEETAEDIANSVFKRAVQKGSGIDSNPASLISIDNKEAVRDHLLEAGLSSNKVARIMGDLHNVRESMAGGARAKHRTTVDLTHTNGDGLSLIDVVQNDMHLLARQYSEEMSGRSALAEKGIRTDADWNNYKEAVMNDIDDTYTGAKKSQIMAKTTEQMDGVYEAMLGRPRIGGVNRNARRLMEYSRLALMGAMGFSQLAETGQILGRHGLKAFKAMSPEYRKMIGAVMNKEGDSTLLGELGSLGGDMWNEHNLFRPSIRLEQKAGVDGNFLQGMDRKLAQGQHVLGHASGFNKVRSEQMAVSAVLEADKLGRLVLDSDYGSVANLHNRLQAQGIDESLFNNIQKEVRKNAVRGPKGNIDRLHLDKWDAETAENFVLSVNRSSRQMIQTNSLGETSTLLEGTAARLVTQYLQFPIVAMEKQTARAMMMGDTEAVVTAMCSLSTAFMAYGARMSAYGRLDEIESEEQFIRGAMNYWAQLGYIGETIDLMAALGAVPSEWHSGNVGRYGSARQPDLMGQFTPASFSSLGGLGKAAHAGVKKVRTGGEYEWTDSDYSARDIASPFGNTLLMHHVFNVGDDE